MGNKHSSPVVPPQSREQRIGVDTNNDHSAPVSRISLRYHKSQASLLKSISSHDTLSCEKPSAPPHNYHPNVAHSISPTLSNSAYTPLTPSGSRQDAEARAYSAFLKSFPEYQSTWILDTLRRTDFARLDRIGETYVDYMGGAQHPESLVRVHSAFLTETVMGNTHSVSNRYGVSINRPPIITHLGHSSKLSTRYADEARDAVLSFFRAPPGYTVVFTANATAALKLVGEAYPFKSNSGYILGADSHNSVHGIREYASRRGAEVHYIPSTSTGGFVLSTAKVCL